MSLKTKERSVSSLSKGGMYTKKKVVSSELCLAARPCWSDLAGPPQDLLRSLLSPKDAASEGPGSGCISLT